MEPASEFIVRVKRWPAYTLAVLVSVLAVLYTCLAVLLAVHGGWSSQPILFIVMVVAQAVATVLFARVALQAFTMIRHPPRVSLEGLRLWLFPASRYVLVEWERVAAVRTFVKGIARGLFVYVHDPESLAGGEKSKLRRLKRAMRRWGGAPFVYAIQASPTRLTEIDHALWRFSEGRQRLHNQ